MMFSTILLVGSTLLLGASGQFFLKAGVDAHPPSASFIALATTFTSWRVIAGLSLYAISTVGWLFVLKRLPLSLAYPTLSLNYIAIVMIGFLVFGEAITLNKFIGVSAIIIGVFALYV